MSNKLLFLILALVLSFLGTIENKFTTNAYTYQENMTDNTMFTVQGLHTLYNSFPNSYTDSCKQTCE